MSLTFLFGSKISKLILKVEQNSAEKLDDERFLISRNLLD
jgi:hypothetical protein